ncbi:MAG: hypothetical protein ACKO96_13090 [Flammeovirgaceae bacterium]
MEFNSGFDADVILSFKVKLQGRTFLELPEEDSPEQFRHFQFVGLYKGKEVVYDAIMYTLWFQHELELYELAEHEAAKHFPNYKKLHYQEDENGNFMPLDSEEEAIGLYMAEVILELQEEEVVKVREHVDIDENVDFGVGLDIGLHRETISDRSIEEFITSFNSGTLTLDNTLYSFHQQEGASTT